MYMTKQQNLLLKLSDKQYALFTVKLIPGIDPDSVIGVRIPELRKLAKDIYKENKYNTFIKSLPHKYHEENLLHGFIIEQIKDFDLCVKAIEDFLPYIDNWAVCDSVSPKVFAKNKDRLLEHILRWIASDETYTARYGVGMLMKHFLDGDFREEYLSLVSGIVSNEYYINMMCAWYFATALAKQWDSAVPYIENRRLTPEVHRMTIRKAIESSRIDGERKKYLRTFI